MADNVGTDLPVTVHRIMTDQILATKWAIPLLRILVRGPARFTHLKSELPELSANILSARLRLFQEVGLVQHIELPPPASCHVYELTERADGVRPILDAIDAWTLMTLDRAD